MDILFENLAKTRGLEGGVFVKISLTYLGRYYVARKDIYTVKNGIVYSISTDGKLSPTGDSLWSLKRDCHRIGQYDPNKKYTFNSCTFRYSEIKKLLNL